jgi:hypothetical protein
LENLLQRLVRESEVPRKVVAAANLIREMGNLGVHGFGETVSAADVERALAQLVPVLAWYREEVGPSLDGPATGASPGPGTGNRQGPIVLGLAVLIACLALAGSLIPRGWKRTQEPPWDEGLAAAPALRVMLGEARPPDASAGVKASLSLDILRAEPAPGDPARVSDGDTLYSGDSYHLEVRPRSNGYLYVIQVDSVGKLTLLHPSLGGLRFATGRNPVHAGQFVRVPSTESGQNAELDDTRGVEHVYCVLTTSAWPELEQAIVDAEKSHHPDVAVGAPFRVKSRGVARLVPAKDAAGSPTFEGDHGVLVVGRWFRHESR